MPDLDNGERLGREPGLQVALTHYKSLADAAANINTYRQQVVTLWVTAFAPVAGSLIVLVAKSPKGLGSARLPLAATLFVFGLTSVALGLWSQRMHVRQSTYRDQMLTIMTTVQQFFTDDVRSVAAVYLDADPWKQRSDNALPNTPLLAYGLYSAAFLGFVTGLWVALAWPPLAR